jgi:hypothetical protein
MSGKARRPAGPSKTDLRRGQLTPNRRAVLPVATRKTPAATTDAEQAFLFEEGAVERSLPRPDR